MPLWTCEQCGAQFPDSAAPPASCLICAEERQYVNWKGQTWIAREELAKRNKVVWRDDLGLLGIGVEPSLAIGQRALLIREPDGCVMWDCIPLVTPEAVEHVRSLGGLKAIAISHPHYYGAVADWSDAFGGVPIYLHGDDRAMDHPAASRDRLMAGDSHRLSDDIVLVRAGGHFAGGTVLHWRAGAGGRGALLTGDIAMVAMDRRSLSFMYSLSEPDPAQRGRGPPHRARDRAAGVRPHLRRLVGPQHRSRRQGGVRLFRSGDIWRRYRTEPVLRRSILPPQIASLYQGFPRLPADLPSEPPMTTTERCRRIPAVPGRGRRTAAPDGAFGLFGDRYLPARADLERVGRLRQAAL